MAVEDNAFVGFMKVKDGNHWSKVGGDTMGNALEYYAKCNLMEHLPIVVVVIAPDYGMWTEQEYEIREKKVEITRIK